jgi:hypothetical protein
LKPKNENTILKHMGLVHEKHGGKISGRIEPWVVAKTKALEVLADQSSLPGPPPSILDLGVGDTMHFERWERFPDCDYLGIDGCEAILQGAKERNPEKAFLLLRFSQLVAQHDEGHRWPVGCIVALDVLWHIPEDEIYEGMLRILFGDGEHDFALVSYPIAMAEQMPGNPGEPGFGRVPRPFTAPEGWEAIHTDVLRERGKVTKRLALYKRSEGTTTMTLDELRQTGEMGETIADTLAKGGIEKVAFED